MDLVINTCYGGFGLSPKAVKRLADLQGRLCYFFKQDLSNGRFGNWVPISEEEAATTFMWHAFDVPNPSEVLGHESPEQWHSMTLEERQADNARYSSHSLDSRPSNRADPLLIQVVRELGEDADGAHAQLKIVTIPDDVEWEIDEYDGSEHVAEVHRTWR